MAEKHYYEQIEFTRSYLLPFLQKHVADLAQRRVLEIGCAEAGFLAVLHQLGINVSGVELSADRVAIAREKMPQLDVRIGDVTDRQLPEKLGKKFDLIVMREVIEHVPDRNAVFANLRDLLSDHGLVYITFPPRFSPFAGHQQVGRSLLRKIPYLHYWPAFLLRPVGRWCGEYDYLIKEVLHNFRIGLSVRRFEKYCSKYGFDCLLRELFIVRPIFQQRFGWKPVHLANLAGVREVLTTGCECLLIKK